MELIVFFEETYNNMYKKWDNSMQPANNLSKEYPKCICAKNLNNYFDTMV